MWKAGATAAECVAGYGVEWQGCCGVSCSCCVPCPSAGSLPDTFIAAQLTPGTCIPVDDLYVEVYSIDPPSEGVSVLCPPVCSHPQTVNAKQGGPSRIRFFDFFLVKDRPKGPPTANHQLPPTANRHQPPRQPPAATNRQPPTTANRHQPPITNHQPPPTTTNRHQTWLNI